MSMKFEAAVVTKKRTGEEFNTDSVNINGKVLPRDVILNGYKGAGEIDETAYFALVSSFVEGYADAAVAGFEEQASAFSVQGANAVSVINDYFRGTVKALNELNRLSKEISIGAIYCGNRNVIMARSGETQLYSYSAGTLKKVNPENSMHDDGKSNYGCYTFADVSEGDIFLMISPGTGASLTDKDLTDICRISEGSVKKIINIISRVAEGKPASGGIGAFAVKILKNDRDAESEAAGFVADIGALTSAETDDTPVNAEADDDKAPELPAEAVTVVGGSTPVLPFAEESSLSEEGTDENSETDKVEAGDNGTANSSEPVKKKKAGKIILAVAALAIIAAGLFCVWKFTDIFGTDAPVIPVDEITEAELTTEETTEDESTTEEESTTDEESTEESTTEETTTRRRQSYAETTTVRQTTTTEAPSSTEPQSEEQSSDEESSSENESSEVSSEEPPATDEPSSEEEPSSSEISSADEPSSEENFF